MAGYSQPCRLVAAMREPPSSHFSLSLPSSSISTTTALCWEGGACFTDEGSRRAGKEPPGSIARGGDMGWNFVEEEVADQSEKSTTLFVVLSLSFLRPPFVRPGFGLSYCLYQLSIYLFPCCFFSLFFKEYQTEIGTTCRGKREGNDETRQHRVLKKKTSLLRKSGKKGNRHAAGSSKVFSNIFFCAKVFSRNAEDLKMTSLKFSLRGKSEFFRVHCFFSSFLHHFRRWRG